MAIATIATTAPAINGASSGSRAERETLPLALACDAAILRASRANDRAQAAAQRANVAVRTNDFAAALEAYETAVAAAHEAMNALMDENRHMTAWRVAAERIVAQEIPAGCAIGPRDRQLGVGAPISLSYSERAQAAHGRAFRSFEKVKLFHRAYGAQAA